MNVKILIITHYPELYGANLSLLTFLIDRNKNQNDILVIIPSLGPLSDRLDSNNIPYVLFPIYNSVIKDVFSDHLKVPFKFLLYMFYFFRLFFFILKLNPDFIYSNSSVLTQGAICSFLLRKKHVWHIREFGKNDYNLIHFFPQFVINYLFKKSYLILSISKSISDFYSTKYSYFHSQLLYNGIIDCIDFDQAFLSYKQKKILFLGFLSFEKNPIEALLAFNEIKIHYPFISIDFIGSGDPIVVNLMEKLISKFDLTSSVFLKGYKEFDEINFDEYSSLFVCSNSEAFGRVVVEGMSKGLIVYGKNCGGVPEIIFNGINGFLYNNDHLDLVKVYLNSINYYDLSEIQKNALKHSLLFSKDKYLRALNDIFNV